jgi:anti-sigma regulatory factor (Ser/Thr protein kinase)
MTVPGKRQEVSRARGFVARTLAESAAGGGAAVDPDAATLLTSELVTNAILHTASGGPGGVVSVRILGLADGALVEVTDGGSAATPVVKADPLAGEGQGLYLVQQMASQWGYRRDQAGTTVWFYLAARPGAADPGEADGDPPGRAREAGGGWPAGGHRGPHYGGPHNPCDPGDPGDQQRAAASTPAQIAARSSSLVV